jgi:hypothetical protein
MSSTRRTDAALELVHEIRALETSGSALGPIDDRRIRAVVTRVKELEAAQADTLRNPHINADDPYYAGLPAHLRTAMLRDKRCLVAYLQWRLDSVTQLWWEGREDSATHHMTSVEAEYARQHSAVLADYMTTAFPVPLDLRAYTSRPPSFPPTNMVKVRGLAEVAFVSPSSFKTVSMYKGKTGIVAFEDAERLVQQGAAEFMT